MSTTAPIPPPVRVRSLPTLHEAIRTVGELDARRAAIRLKVSKAVERLRAKSADELADLDEAVADHLGRIASYVGANRDAVLGDKKTVMTEAGEIAVRALPRTITVSDEQAAIDDLANRGLDAYVRHTVALDKRALVKDQPTGVPGIEYVEGRQQVVVVPITSGEKIAVEI